eukprot:SAG31_NODE_10612_length_1117_cov_10.919450_1_plen_277_part_10
MKPTHPPSKILTRPLPFPFPFPFPDQANLLTGCAHFAANPTGQSSSYTIGGTEEDVNESPLIGKVKSSLVWDDDATPTCIKARMLQVSDGNVSVVRRWVWDAESCAPLPPALEASRVSHIKEDGSATTPFTVMVVEATPVVKGEEVKGSESRQFYSLVSRPEPQSEPAQVASEPAQVASEPPSASSEPIRQMAASETDAVQSDGGAESRVDSGTAQIEDETDVVQSDRGAESRVDNGTAQIEDSTVIQTVENATEAEPVLLPSPAVTSMYNGKMLTA